MAFIYFRQEDHFKMKTKWKTPGGKKKTNSKGAVSVAYTGDF